MQEVITESSNFHHMQKKKKEPQNVRILKWFLEGRKLTQAKAYKLFDCFRLSARVKDLRKWGFDIKADMVRTATKKKIAEYFL